MSDFARALYADIFDADDLDDATRDWFETPAAERSFVQVHLLWLIHEQLASLNGEMTRLADLLAHLNKPAVPETVDVIELRLLHLGDELPRVRAKTLDITPLALGVDRVHRQ